MREARQPAGLGILGASYTLPPPAPQISALRSTPILIFWHPFQLSCC